ncbi:Tiparp [Symbiodinium natans]|uniref:Tiparp protein n=1 Tax=Symbiodinium natans TaxID=878477 RepID=A0A812MPA5_9DINO|nr:Tiparp [Symbiodinium natans]
MGRKHWYICTLVHWFFGSIYATQHTMHRKHLGQSPESGTRCGEVGLSSRSRKVSEYLRGLMAMLVCRCLVGEPYVVHDPGDAVTEAKALGMDCVVGDRESKVGTYREFIFFDERQVYPEFAVIYRRQYEVSKVPSLMRKKTSGTTGRNWQVQLDKGWTNVPPDVSSELTRAESMGVKQVERKIGDFTYVFDLEKKLQLNTASGKSRKIRRPMRS